jgi:hypothetical protein
LSSFSYNGHLQKSFEIAEAFLCEFCILWRASHRKKYEASLQQYKFLSNSDKVEKCVSEVRRRFPDLSSSLKLGRPREAGYVCIWRVVTFHNIICLKRRPRKLGPQAKGGVHTCPTCRPLISKRQYCRACISSMQLGAVDRPCSASSKIVF